MIDLNAIKAAAKAATPGWYEDKCGALMVSEHEPMYMRGATIAIAGSRVEQAKKNTSFIAAANPAAVLEMAELIERLESELAAERATIQRMTASAYDDAEKIDRQEEAARAAARPAVALSDEHIEDLADEYANGDAGDFDALGFARAILAAQQAPADAGQAQALADAELPLLPGHFGMIDVYSDSDFSVKSVAGYTADQMRGYVLDDRACMALRQPGEVWVVGSKTFSMVFATEELANKFISSGSPSVTGGMSITRCPVIGTPAAPVSQPAAQERDSKITSLIAEIRAAKTLARRDSLFEQIIEAWEAAPAPLSAPAGSEQEGAARPAAAVRHAERIDAMHKGVVGVFAAVKAEHDANLKGEK
jgi:hypothetical protein